MMSITEYFMFWFLVFCASGASVYILDFWCGQSMRKWWYDMIHEDSLPETETRGFLYRRNFRTRLRMAVCIGIIGSIIVILKTEFRPIAELFLWIACVPAVFAGFWLGPFICRLWKSRDKALHALENIEEHGIDIHGGAQRALRHVREGLHHMQEHVHPTIAEPNNSIPPLQPEQPSPEPTAEEVRAMMGKYLKGRNP